MRLAAEHGVSLAPFFLVREGEGAPVVYDSVLRLVKERLTAPVPAAATAAAGELDVAELAQRLATAHPRDILRAGLERFGDRLGIAWSGAEDVVLLHMALEAKLPFTAFCIDTGRLHPETYRYLDRVRRELGIELAVVGPDPRDLEPFVRKKGLFSFYEDGHEECCGVRKVAPLRRTLAALDAWATGQRRDQSPSTRSAVAVVEADATFTGRAGRLVKFNPLAAWTSAEVWQYLRDEGLPYNALHERGFVSIGCEPCTRAVLPGEHERAGRWWWEENTQRECGLHAGNLRRAVASETPR
ncbi:MAG: phosphoadenylyl-sulfate reductase [Deltaproteobacteria bacterium]|nr:phosphoadenylyl-sulfate reductase [Deltaproteobacteria bacterium]